MSSQDPSKEQVVESQESKTEQKQEEKKEQIVTPWEVEAGKLISNFTCPNMQNRRRN